MLRNGHSLQSSHGSLSDKVNAMKGNMSSHDEFVASVQQRYSDNVNAVEEAYNNNVEKVNQEYNNFQEKVNNEFESTQQQLQQKHDEFLAQKAAYEASHSGYQDYSSSIQKLGLHNSSVVSHSESIEIKSHEFDGNSASYRIYEQTEF